MKSDRFSKTHRSKLMSKIKSKDTKFESDFISCLKRQTRKSFKLNVKEIKGCPDIVFEKYRVCIFLDSDFWHGWQYSRWKDKLKTDFWFNKIESTRKRDKQTTAYLRRNGWIVLRIWEHNIKNNIQKEINKILKLIN